MGGGTGAHGDGLLQDGPPMTFAEYRQIRAWNWSLLRLLIDGGPVHVRYAMEHPNAGDTASRRLLRAIHAATLTPESWDDDYIVTPGARSAVLVEAARQAGRELLTVKEAATARTIGSIVRAHPVAGPIVTGDGWREKTIGWTDPTTGLPCKARLDCLQMPDPKDTGTLKVWDLKTLGSVSEAHVSSRVRRQGIAGQLAHYRDGMRVRNPGREVTAGLIVVELRPPHDVAVFPLLPADLDEADEPRRELLSTIRRCVDTDTWPGRYTEPVPLSLTRDDGATVTIDTDDNETTDEEEPF